MRRHLFSERKIGLAVLVGALGIILASQASLFARPTLVSEKGLLQLLLGVGLVLTSVFVAVRSIKKV